MIDSLLPLSYLLNKIIDENEIIKLNTSQGKNEVPAI
jgi:hypothetical protein